MTPEPCAASPFAARLPRQATPRADWPPPRVSGLRTPLSPLRPRPQQIINNRVKLEGQRGGRGKALREAALGAQTAGGLEEDCAGRRGRREGADLGRTLHRGKKLAEARQGPPASAAGARTPGPWRDGTGGAWWAGAGPGELGRSLAAQKPVGGAWRHVREEGARRTGSPRTRRAGGWRACLPAHVCVIFELECGARGAPGAWGRPRRRRDAVRPALPRPSPGAVSEAARLARNALPA